LIETEAEYNVAVFNGRLPEMPLQEMSETFKSPAKSSADTLTA
jgi:hypothetical protein